MTERLVVDRSADHPAWDDFLARTPGGGYLQTSRWARVKAVVGLRAVRLLTERYGEIVSGCQLLVRDVPLLGAVAYSPRGPVIGDGADADALLRGLRELARQERIGFLKLQPPPGGEGFIPALEAHGFDPSDDEIAPTATTRVPLTGRSDEDLRAAMRATTRRRLRQGEKSDIRVRVGDENDLPILQRLLEATAQRQGFGSYPLRYHQAMWRAFGPGDGARLLVAESGGRPLSAALLIGFGDTAVYKVGAWDGSSGSGRPNELVHWSAQRWGRDRGFAYYDFEGMNLAAARALVRGNPLPDDVSGVTFFKLGFGGEVAIFPQARDLVLPTILGRTMRNMNLPLRRWGALRHLVAGRRS